MGPWAQMGHGWAMGTHGPQWAMGPNGPKWVQIDPKLSTMTQNGLNVVTIGAQIGPTLTRLRKQSQTRFLITLNLGWTSVSSIGAFRCLLQAFRDL